MSPRSLSPAEVAEGLRLLADAVESGRVDVGAAGYPDQALHVSLVMSSSESVRALSAEFGVSVDVGADDPDRVSVDVPFGTGVRSDGWTTGPIGYRAAVVLAAFHLPPDGLEPGA